MKCPVCKNHKNVSIDIHTDGFAEDIVTCSICGTVWAINHGLQEIIKDSQEKSFLSTTSDCVETDAFSLAA